MESLDTTSYYTETYDEGFIHCAAYLKLFGMPKTANKLLGASKWVVKKNRDYWKRAVMSELVRLQCIPREPTLQATLTLRRYSSRSLDFDGLVSSFKPVVDGLCTQRHTKGFLKGEIAWQGVLAHDGFSVTGVWDVNQGPAPKGQTWITVKIEWTVKAIGGLERPRKP